LLDGRPLDMSLAHVALAVQHARLQLLRATVLADVAAASGSDQAAARGALGQVGLDPVEFGGRRIDQLSGGEQRRVALAGLLAARPRLLVLDEPFAGLDTAGREGLTAVLIRLRAETGLTLVIVSHDLEGTERVTDRVLRLDRGRIVGDTPVVERAGPPPTPRRTRRELHLFRPVPGDSVVHRLWAGTKLIGLVAIAVALSIQPAWPALGVMAGVVALGLGVARIPWGAVPRLPRWFWIGVLSGGLLTLQAGGRPNVHVLGLTIGVGALGEWLRASAFAIVVLVAAALVSWTTPLADVAPALRRLGAPLRRLRLPVDEGATAVALGIRCLPLLVDEIRTLAAVRSLRAARQRQHQRHADRSRRWRRHLTEPQDLLTAALVVAVRRGDELADAIEARGGLGRFADDDRGPGVLDALALALVLVAVVGALIV
jgi:energy-coupling factor transport system ATP-binding protein